MAAGDEPVNFNRKSAELIGRTIKEFRGRGRGELPIARRRRAPDGSGGGNSTAASSLAIVTTEAAANAGSIGACTRLRAISTGGLEESANAADIGIQFQSGHQYAACPVGERIQLIEVSGIETVMGVEFPFAGNFGLLTDCIVELKQRAGFGTGKSLVGGAAATDIAWAGAECPPP